MIKYLWTWLHVPNLEPSLFRLNTFVFILAEHHTTGMPIPANAVYNAPTEVAHTTKRPVYMEDLKKVMDDFEKKLHVMHAGLYTSSSKGIYFKFNDYVVWLLITFEFFLASSTTASAVPAGKYCNFIIIIQL